MKSGGTLEVWQKAGLDMLCFHFVQLIFCFVLFFCIKNDFTKLGLDFANVKMVYVEIHN